MEAIMKVEESVTHVAFLLEKMAQLIDQGKADGTSPCPDSTNGAALGMAHEAQRLMERVRFLRNGRFTLLVAGGFNNGKSTLVNALLETEAAVLTGAVPTTAVITRLSHGEKRRIWVTTREGERKEIDQTAYEQEYDAAERDGKPGVDEKGRNMPWGKDDEIEISDAFSWLPQGMNLVDMPGLAEDPWRTALALEYLPQASAVIVLLHAKRQLSKDDLNLIALLGDKVLKHVFFVINFIDTVPPDELSLVEQWVGKRLRPLYTGPDGTFDEDLYKQRVFFLSAYNAVKTITNSSTDAPEVQGITAHDTISAERVMALRAQIDGLLEAEDRQQLELRTLIPFLASIVRTAQLRIDKLRRASRQPIEDLQASIDKTEARLQKVVPLAKVLEQRVAQAGEVFQYQIYSDLLQYVRDLRNSWKQDAESLDLDELANHNLLSTKFSKKQQQKFAETLSRELELYLQRKLSQWGAGLPKRLQRSAETLLADIGQDMRACQLVLEDLGISATGGMELTVSDKRSLATFDLLAGKQQAWFEELFSNDKLLRLIGPMLEQQFRSFIDASTYKNAGLTIARELLQVGSWIFGAKGKLIASLMSRVGGEVVEQMRRRFEYKTLMEEGRGDSERLEMGSIDLETDKTNRLHNAVRETIVEGLHEFLFERIEESIRRQREVICSHVDKEFQGIAVDLRKGIETKIGELRGEQQRLLDSRHDLGSSLEQEQQRLEDIDNKLRACFDEICTTAIGSTLTLDEIQELHERHGAFISPVARADEEVPFGSPLLSTEGQPKSKLPLNLAETRIDSFKARELITDRVLSGLVSSDDELTGISTELSQMVGLDSVKRRIQELLAYQERMRQRREQGLQLGDPPSLHLVFTGNPGTGKSTVGEMIGRMYKRLGLLKRGHMLPPVTRGDLVGQYVGHTAPRVKKVIERAIDGVLFIDEAHTLASTNGTNDFGQEAISALNFWMEKMRGRLAIIVAGYSEEMELFLDSDPGLKGRFPASNRIHFPDFEPSELLRIFQQQLKGQAMAISPGGLAEVERVIEGMYAQRRADFGNAREMRNFVEALVRKHATRAQREQLPAEAPIEPEDIDEHYRNYIRTQPSAVADLDEVMAPIRQMIGLPKVKEWLERLVARALWEQERGNPIQAESLHMVFYGPSGTGKTTVANHLGKILHALGFLRRGHLVSATRSDLVSEYLGKTGIKVRKLVEGALDGVLFVDEAYSLYQPGSVQDYGSEAISELLKLMEEHRDRLVVVFAGYRDEMDLLLQSNSGLRGRFRTPVDFTDYTEVELIEIAREMVDRDKLTMTSAAERRILFYLNRERQADPRVFGNARSVRRLLDEAKDRLASRVGELSGDEYRRAAQIIEAEDIPTPTVFSARATKPVDGKFEVGASAADALVITMVSPASDRFR
jgi:SpoVK/Ycf46/Vps4 family AAA+-type ATPase/tRNA U34 5-carboxymethylaminomethyl modifying GTPase MnmE/TrmE